MKMKIRNQEISEESKKIYLIAGVLAILGSVIIIIKTRKK